MIARARLWLLALLPQVGLAAVGCYLFTSVDNTLRKSGYWVATKALLERRAIGSEAFATSRQTVSTETLDLGRWFGFQEVLVAEPVELGEVAFDFKLSAGSYLCFVFEKTATGFTGLRLSACEGVDDLYFRANDKGEFTEALPLEVAARADEWHSFRASFGKDTYLLTLDGDPILEHSGPFERLQVFGFRNGMRTVLIDDVRVESAGGAGSFSDSFFPQRDFARLFGLTVLGVLLVNGLGLLLLARSDNAVEKVGSRLLIVGGVLFAGSLVGTYFYRSIFSKEYPLADLDVEEAWLQELAVRVREEIRSKHEPKPEPGVVRVLVMGSSQTWGAGATRHGESLVDFLQRDLDALGGPRFECINAGISGFTAARLLEIYAEEWVDLEPAVAVVNLSTNDSHDAKGDGVDEEGFARALEGFARLNAERGIRTLFVLEANSTEYRPEGPPLHATMRRVAAAEGVPLVDAHAYVKAREELGFLWWDFVHPSSLGHELIAEVLAPAVAEVAAADRDR